MSKQALGQVVQRAISDAAFRRQLRTDPAGALQGSDLTAAERSALGSGDAAKLASLGVDQRMSKIFMLGDASIGVFSHTGGTDLTQSAAHEIPGGSGLDVRSALTTTDGSNADAALLAPNDAMRGGGAITSGGEGAAGGAVLDGGADDIRGVILGPVPGSRGDAFLTDDEASRATVESGAPASDSHGMVIDSADVQRELLDGGTAPEHGTGDLQSN